MTCLPLSTWLVSPQCFSYVLWSFKHSLCILVSWLFQKHARMDFKCSNYKYVVLWCTCYVIRPVNDLDSRCCKISKCTSSETLLRFWKIILWWFTTRMIKKLYDYLHTQLWSGQVTVNQGRLIEVTPFNRSDLTTQGLFYVTSDIEWTCYWP